MIYDKRVAMLCTSPQEMNEVPLPPRMFGIDTPLTTKSQEAERGSPTPRTWSAHSRRASSAHGLPASSELGNL